MERHAKEPRDLSHGIRAHLQELAIYAVERERLPGGIDWQNSGAAGFVPALRCLPSGLRIRNRSLCNGALETQNAARARSVTEQARCVTLKHKSERDGFAALADQTLTLVVSWGWNMDEVGARNLAAVQFVCRLKVGRIDGNGRGPGVEPD